MAVTFAVGLRACCVAVALLLATVRAAEPASPLIGATREQVLTRYGEPKSQLAVGNRLVLNYPRERIVLRDDIVVEVEPLTAEPVRRPSEAETTSGATTPAETAPGSRPGSPAVQPPSSGEPELKIKRVLPPSAKDARSTSPEPQKAAPVTSTPAPEPVRPTKAEEPPTKAKTTVVTPAVSIPVEETVVVEKAAPKSDAKAKAEQLAEQKKKEDALKAARRRMQEAAAETTVESPISTRTYLLAFVILAGGIAVLYWRHRQRQLELAATSVVNTPLTPSSPVFSGTGFTLEQLTTLDWRQFEELVAAYYSKTGVVAARTNTGPDSPVHIKISWKGEPRPFAFVQCIVHPTGLIEPKPLHALVGALNAENIRRGYVVTTGKFSVPARDLAEEKHLTLLPGETFIEKLNALPAPARAEVMQAIAASDASVPSCPKCQTKMVRASDNPAIWRCPNHPEQTVPVKIAS